MFSGFPPEAMTFFRGLVVELNGAERSTLDIQRYALQPVRSPEVRCGPGTRHQPDVFRPASTW